MRRIWLAVIALTIVAVVVLAFTWRNIPYLNTWVIESPVLQPVRDLRVQIEDTVKNNPTQILGVAGGSIGILLTTIRTLYNKVNDKRTELQQLRVLGQEKLGFIKAEAEDAKEELNQQITQLKQEKADLQRQYSDQVTNLEGVVSNRDSEILSLNRQLTSVQATMSEVQLDLNKTKQELITATTKRDEYLIQLTAEEQPTLH